MKVVICGDSFMSVDARAPGKHFSELLNYDVVNLAFPGVGNIDICYQIKEAIKLQADFVVIGTTDPGRIELPYIDKHTSPEINLSNFRPGLGNYTFKSTTIPSFIGEEPDLKGVVEVSKEQRLAVKMYLAYMYNYHLKNDTDNWAIGYWTSQLEKNSIAYKILPRDFCIYTSGQGDLVPWTFHTGFEVQEKAAREVEELIRLKN